jgi:hypothetical protein
MWIFRTRSADRDQETDNRRLNRLTAVLDEIVSEMTIEREGLEARCRKTKEDAAFSLLALENGADKGMSEKVDRLTMSLILATDRLRLLQDQIAFMGKVIDETTAFARRTVIETTQRRKAIDDQSAPNAPSSVPRPSRKA